MKPHANAALSSRQQRERMARRVVELGWSLTRAAAAAEVSERTCSKWVRRYRGEGLAGLADRSSAPGVVSNRTEEQTVQVIAALRRLRFTGPDIAELLDRPLSTVSGILTRIGMGKLGRLGMEPANRYERQKPGELIHVDVKKLGRIVGGAGKRVRGGGNHYTDVHAIACRVLGIRHLRTRPRRPQTNGRLERFIRTMLGGWAYGAIYASSAERTAALDGWLWRYNHHRRHSALGRQTPITRLNNLLGTYS